jgi:hypothetical protein
MHKTAMKTIFWSTVMVLIITIILSCSKSKNDPSPSTSSTNNNNNQNSIDTTLPNYFFNITYKGQSYAVNNGTETDLSGTHILPGSIIGGSVIGCSEFNKISLYFTKSYDKVFRTSPYLFDSVNPDLTGFAGHRIPQTSQGSSDTCTRFKYKCSIGLFGTPDNTDFLHKTADINWDTSKYYVLVKEMKYTVYDQSYGYMKGNFNVLLINGDTLKADFLVPN